MTAGELRHAMEAAAATLDFDRARQLRDRLAIVRATGVDPGEEDAGLTRQQPGAMGIGTSQPGVVPPPAWVKPVKPDPMTRGRNRRRKD